MQRILIVDDHPLIRMSMRMLLEQEGYEVVGEIDDGSEVLPAIRKMQPDIIILDIFLPKMDGLKVISRIKSEGSPVKILVVSSQEEQHFAPRCMRAGATGFISKNNGLDELNEAIKAIVKNRVYFPANVYSAVNEGPSENDAALISTLSNRELQIFQYLVRGWSNKKISETMLLSDKTVSTYKVRLMKKLNVQSLVELVDFAKINSVIN
ncbi:response regulator transcription factor [Buttiauxella gaviniae]|uniref:Response regulator transcription factor n=1 Tax=Buttiauxella gaviniae TaxID=82990 RepID=A0ABV3NZN5_9ENTR